MLKKAKLKPLALIAGTLGIIAITSGAYAFIGNSESDHDLRTPVEFFKGHSHHDDHTVGAPQHNGGTNSFGCHNGSVPYHCH